MNDPAYAAQLATIQRQGRWRAAVATPFVAAGIALGIFANRAIGDHLSASMYAPACRAACAKAGGATVEHRVGGRGHLGDLRCACAPAVERWHEADLSRASAADAALHYGGQEVASFLTFALLSVTGLVVGWRASRHVA